ncbi:MAG TPA: alpha/beta hydrolase [Gemmatimonadaceae bacterium]|nr:alpha/beta hydrolase [Gemmatimonadaceae bacterium]
MIPSPLSTRSRALFAALALLLIGALAGVWLIGGALSRPDRDTVGPPPRDLGAETVRLPLAGGRTVVGWLARGVAGQGAVLLLHPLHGDRRAMIGRARFLRRAGYTVLLVDLPAHGESEGDQVTFGVRESEGARAALAFLRRSFPNERVGALGASLGGASLLLGADGPAANAADAVVLEAVYPTIGEAVADRLRIRLGPAGPPLAPLLTLQLRPRLGLDPAAMRPIDRVAELRVPLLVVAGEADRHTLLAESERLFAAAPEPKALWVVPRAPHGDFYAADGAVYERRILAFFDQHLRATRGRPLA